MAKYQVTFTTYQETTFVVSCHRDDALDRAIEQYQEEFRHPPVYDEVEIDEIKP